MAARFDIRWWKGMGGFVVAVAIVVLAFVGTTSFVLLRSRGIGEAARGIKSNAVPSIERLLSARAEVALLRIRIEHHFDTQAAPTALSHKLVWSAVGELRRHVSGYVALPSYRQERELRNELLGSVDNLVASLSRMLAMLKAGDVAGARHLFDEDVRPASERVERLLADSERINVEEVMSFTERMEALDAVSRRDAIILNGLCILVAAILVSWAVGSARRYRDLQQSYVRQSQQRAEEMEVFAGRVAHDILSPLGSASLALTLLSESGDPDVVRLAKRGIAGVGRVQSTVDGLLEFARAGAQPAEDVCTDIVEVANDVVVGLQERAITTGVSLELSADVSRYAVNANRGVLTSILTNLVQNAIKHIGDGPDKRVSVHVADREGRLRVEVRDTGAGVPPDLEARIFEPYFRGNVAMAGIGLGLATVKRLVEAHGGRVGLQSIPGHGSVFWFEMAASRPLSASGELQRLG